MHKLYINIRNRRKELGMSQEELARKTGYSGKSMIAHIEKGEVDLPQSKILLFAKALRVHPGELLDWDDPSEGANDPGTGSSGTSYQPDFITFSRNKPQYAILFEKICKLNDSDLESITRNVDDMLDDYR